MIGWAPARSGSARARPRRMLMPPHAACRRSTAAAAAPSAVPPPHTPFCTFSPPSAPAAAAPPSPPQRAMAVASHQLRHLFSVLCRDDNDALAVACQPHASSHTHDVSSPPPIVPVLVEVLQSHLNPLGGCTSSTSHKTHMCDICLPTMMSPGITDTPLQTVKGQGKAVKKRWKGSGKVEERQTAQRCGHCSLCAVATTLLKPAPPSNTK